jgi:hypothetical protein
MVYSQTQVYRLEDIVLILKLDIASLLRFIFFWINCIKSIGAYQNKNTWMHREQERQKIWICVL